MARNNDENHPFGEVDARRLKALTLGVGETLRDALQAIDDGQAGVCVVCTDDGRFSGLLTDGDVRRALLAGATLESALGDHIGEHPLIARPDEVRDNVLDTMRSRRVDVMPIVSRDGKLVGLHALAELISPQTIDNLAVIMAGGRGTRLGQLTETTPKPMLEVAGRPILERIVTKLVGEGVRNIAISVNYLADVITDHFGDGRAFGCAITYLRESPDRPLGTGGSLSLLAGSGLTPGLPILVMNGDVLCDAPLADLLAYHQAADNAITLCSSVYNHAVPFGVVRTVDDRVQSLIEKPQYEWRVNAGIYVVAPEMVDAVPPDTNFPITGLVEEALARQHRVGAFRLHGSWLDIGQPAELRQARGHQ